MNDAQGVWAPSLYRSNWINLRYDRGLVSCELIVIGIGRNGMYCSSCSQGSGSNDFEALFGAITTALCRMFPGERVLEEAIQLSRYDYLGTAGVIADGMLGHFEGLLEGSA